MEIEKISSEELDRRFDDGEEVLQYFDLSSARRPGLEVRRVNVDFPDWMIRNLDEHAKKRGVTRQALIKMWLADRLEAAG
ncbi:type II toxin-antitoxin system BrnA family antitoxin [Sphingomonas sp. M1-B02]|uniref:type II toxin-antitoxin system BrnA family antitoxin n=1 Tax=Sphingomonas sp. M1-B02 TaxID=3114300 RepID=UPI002240B894|nr:CopG family antitoxin [Sphingomonas sp. S6-11]UZK65693.1 BrnA antitoxin family protein [Sphingomonas sp. S6-11]